MCIRKATAQDASKIAAIGQCVWIDTYATEGVRKSIGEYVLNEFTIEKIEGLLESNIVFVLEVDLHLVGYVVVINGVNPEIESLYVLPRQQGSGHGTRLMRHVVSKYKNLWLSCWERNSQAIRFYNALGFIETGESFFELEEETHRNVLLKYSS